MTQESDSVWRADNGWLLSSRRDGMQYWREPQAMSAGRPGLDMDTYLTGGLLLTGRGMTCQYQNSYGTIAAGGGISQTAFACQKSRHFLQGNKILSAAIRRVQIPS